jgi:hypothetical protein
MPADGCCSMIRAVTFASCYVYSPGGSGASCVRSRLMRSLLKEGDAYFIDKYAGRVRQQVAEGPSLAGFFGAGSVLVPIPGCTPRFRGKESVADHLAGALLGEGLGQSIWRGLRRVSAVPKSATAVPGLRPSVGDHYASLAVTLASPSSPSLPLLPLHIILVDDIVTKGRTLLAAAARVREAFPTADVRAFALIRTLGLIPAVDHLLDPCVGEIRWSRGDAHRVP